MSTLALRPVGTFAPAAKPSLQSGFLQRLIRARETEARRRVRVHLAALGDGHLRDLGFSGDDIAALRAGEARLPR